MFLFSYFLIAFLANQNRVSFIFSLIFNLLHFFAIVFLYLGREAIGNNLTKYISLKCYESRHTVESSKFQNTTDLPLISLLFESINLLTVIPIIMAALLLGKLKIPVEIAGIETESMFSFLIIFKMPKFKFCTHQSNMIKYISMIMHFYST